MNLLIDEGVDRQIVARLRDEGPNVLYVAEMEPGIRTKPSWTWQTRNAGGC